MILENGGRGIDSQGLFNTQPPTGDSVLALEGVYDGDHAANGSLKLKV